MANVTVINFTLASAGLEDQLLALVVVCERPDLEEAKNQLMTSNAMMRQQLQEIEDRVLLLISSTQGSPVDDERLIDTLAASKKTAEEIEEKVGSSFIKNCIVEFFMFAKEVGENCRENGA